VERTEDISAEIRNFHKEIQKNDECHHDIAGGAEGLDLASYNCCSARSTLALG
jgi:hypothetical protein